MVSKIKAKLRLEKESAMLANERTFLSYIRTTFSALILGFALIQFSQENNAMLRVGIATIIGGVFIGVIGVVEYSLHKKKIIIESEE